MRIFFVALAGFWIAHVTSVSWAADQSRITTLSPDEAERLICTDDQCRPVTLTRRVTVTKCKLEERTKDTDGKILTYTVSVPYTEEVLQTYTVMCRGDLLSLDNLGELSPETARVLARHTGFLHLDGLKAVSADVATILASHKGSLSLGGIETISHETADALADHPGVVTCAGLKRVDAATYETLKLKQALPPSVTVENANTPTVVWCRRGPRRLANYRDTLADQMDVHVTIDPSLAKKYGITPKQKLAPPPRKVMYQHEAIRWLASELGKENAGSIAGEFTEKGLEFREVVTP